MKLSTTLLFLFIISFCNSQYIKIDTGYTVVLKGEEDKPAIMSHLYGDLGRIMIKENSSGKTCMPVSMHWTFIIQAEIFQTDNVTEAKKYFGRSTPKDKIFIEKIVLSPGCFPPPKQIVIAII
jgi:hypothetical protein